MRRRSPGTPQQPKPAFLHVVLCLKRRCLQAHYASAVQVATSADTRRSSARRPARSLRSASASASCARACLFMLNGDALQLLPGSSARRSRRSWTSARAWHPIEHKAYLLRA